MNPRIPFLAAIFILLSLTYCGDDNPASPSPDPNDPNVVSEEIGVNGGDITSSDGRLTLTIPAGAMANTETITIEKITPDELGSEFDQIVSELGVEATYDLGPDGLNFENPVTVSFQSNQTPVQEDDSISVFPEFLFTSSNGSVEALDNLQTVSDFEQGSITIQGELTHFSPLVTSQANNGVSFFVFNVPESLPVGGMFTADAQIFESTSGPLGDLVTVLGPGNYEDQSGAPIAPLFSPTTADLPGNSDDGFKRTFDYTCTDPGLGVYGSELSVIVRFDLDSGPITAESFAPYLTTVECTEPVTFNLIVDKEGNGVVTSDDGEIDCGEEEGCSAEFKEGSETTLSATPADGWAFDRWEGDLTGDTNPANLTMDGNKSVTAIFVEEQQDPPSIEELVGFWKFIYRFIENTCNDQSGEFSIEAEVIQLQGEYNLGVEFPDAEDIISIIYNEETGNLEGMTDKVPVAEELYAQEIWAGTALRGFAQSKKSRTFIKITEHGIFYTGTSLVNVTDAEDELICKIEYEIEGEKTEE